MAFGLTVTFVALGVVVLFAVAGYLIDKSADSADGKGSK